MEDKYILLFITSITSIVVAVISLYSNWRNNSKLEFLKFEIEKKKSNFQIVDEDFKKRFASIGQYISQIQKVKDFITFLQNTSTNSLRTGVASKELNSCVEEALSVYKTESIYMEKIEKEITHEAKTIIYNFKFTFEKMTLNNPYVDFNNDDKNILRDVKLNLSSLQDSLRDIRYNILNEIK